MFLRVKERYYKIALVMLIYSSPFSGQPQGSKHPIGQNCNSTENVKNTTTWANVNCSHLKMANTTSNTNHSNVYNKSATTQQDDDIFLMVPVNMGVTFVGMFCNFLLILVVTIDPLNILRRGAWFTILNLSIADFIACLDQFIKSYLLHVDDMRTLRTIIKEIQFFWMFAVGASFFLLTFLTLQVYAIIKYPMKSRLMLTRDRVALGCIIIWILAIAMGLSEISYLWTKKFFEVYIAGIAVLELATIIQVVLKILIVIEILGSRYEGLSSEIQNEKQKEVAKTVMILNVVLIVTVFPYFVAKQIELRERLVGTELTSYLVKFSYFYEPVAFLNFVANPIMYSLRLQDYRQSLIALFTLKCRSRRRSNSQSSQRTIASKPSISLQENRASIESTKF